MFFNALTRFFSFHNSGGADDVYMHHDTIVAGSSHNSDENPPASPSSITAIFGDEVEPMVLDDLPIVGQQNLEPQMLDGASLNAAAHLHPNEVDVEEDTGNENGGNNDENDVDANDHEEEPTFHDLLDIVVSERYKEHTSRFKSMLPTFDLEHNKFSVTNDYTRCDEWVEKVLVGYVEKTVPDDDESDTEDADGEEAETGDEEKSGEDDDGEKGNEKPKTKKVDGETNGMAMANAIAMGVKVRDFAAIPTQEENHSPAPSETIFKEFPVPEVFPAHEKALQFQHIRFLLKNDVFDLPQIHFTVYDVDRLLTVGFIKSRHLDTFLLGAMIGVAGAIRDDGFNPFDPHRRLPQRSCWTIPKNSRPPTRKEIRKYIIAQEFGRYASRLMADTYILPAAERPELTPGYVLERLYVHGLHGLTTIGILDDESVDQIVDPDEAYIPPQLFVDYWRFRTTSDLCPYCNRSHGPDLSSSYFASAHAGASASLRSNSPGSSEPESSERGRSDVSKGKKRASSPSPDEGEDGSSRRTRVRFSDEVSSTGATSGSSSSSSRGKKRSRDDEGEDPDHGESTPIKKLKTLSGSVAVSADTLSAIGSFTAEFFQTATQPSDDISFVFDYSLIPGAFIEPDPTQLATASPEPGGDADPEPSDSPMNEADDVWRPHPHPPHSGARTYSTTRRVH